MKQEEKLLYTPSSTPGDPLSCYELSCTGAFCAAAMCVRTCVLSMYIGIM